MRIKLLTGLLILLAGGSKAQQKVTISGFVRDSLNGEVLPGVYVYAKGSADATAATNLYGYYAITLLPGTYDLQCSYMGYNEKTVTVNLKNPLTVNFDLSPRVYEKKAVEIKAESNDDNIRSHDMGRAKLDIQTIKTLPAFMGEVDIMKTIQLIPGVKSGGDGNTGIYVRGGGPDQNLILLDEAVIYNPAHLLGFFSVFNGDAVSGVELIKGGMPAQYGGRLASVLDVSMKEGNMKSFHADGGLGVISSRLTLQGPIKKDTSSFIASFRRTYADIVVQPFIKEDSQFKGSGLYFYDANLKVNYIAGSRDRLFLSGYFGRDKFSYEDKEAAFRVEMPWGNATSSVRWNHLFNPKLFLNTTLVFSDFKFEFGADQSDFNFKLFSGIRDWNLKSDFNYYPGARNRMKFGTNYIYHTFTPYNASASQGEVVFDTGKKVNLFAHEAALYISDEFDLTDRILLQGGMRYSAFQQIGPFERYTRNELGQRSDTLFYPAGKEVVTYHGPEPRLLIRILTGSKSSVKASYTRNLQYIHMVSLSAVSLPTDVWVPSTTLVKPQTGNQYAIGFFRNFLDNMYEASVEVYYKNMLNQVEYKEGALPEDNIKENADYNYTFGSGESYGSEFFFKKRTGKFNGWAGYTLSFTTRNFPEINNGKTFYAKFDRRHDFSFIMQYDMNEHWIFSMVFVYGTGNAITMPESRYLIDGSIINKYGERNSVRMAPYHRLDFSATWFPSGRAAFSENRKKISSSWNFSIFNVYSRLNPFFIYFENTGSFTEGTLKIKARQISLFPIIPSITYNFHF